MAVLTEEGRAARNQYRRELYAKNREKERAANTEYWNRKGAEMLKREKENDR